MENADGAILSVCEAKESAFEEVVNVFVLAMSLFVGMEILFLWMVSLFVEKVTAYEGRAIVLTVWEKAIFVAEKMNASEVKTCVGKPNVSEAENNAYGAKENVYAPK
jgi:hypothetical protein